MIKMNGLEEGRRVFDIEINALKKTREMLDETFQNILNLIVTCKGKVIVTGIGKSGHIAAKMAATFASLGTPSFYIHSAEAMHGDLGMISENDIVIAVSFSGESDEIINILLNIKMIGATIVAITGNSDSTLAKAADLVQILPKFDEACHFGLAPTSSTTAVLCYGDALAVAASAAYGFKEENFAKYHPAGSLGKKLIVKVNDLMATGEKNARIHVDETLMAAIVEMSKKGLGAVSIVDDENQLIGLITDGDLRCQLEKKANIYSMTVDEIMTSSPKIIFANSFAFEALKIMKKYNISCLPVVDGGKLVGMIRAQDVISVGIVV